MKATDEQINAAIELLRGNGWVVERPEWGPWRTPMQTWISSGLKISYEGFLKRLHEFAGDYPQRRGRTGRLVKFRTSPELVKWLSRPMESGCRRDLE